MTDWDLKQKELDEESIISLQKRQKALADSKSRGDLKRKQLELSQVESLLFVKRQELQRINVEKIHLEKQKNSILENKRMKGGKSTDAEGKIQYHDKELTRLQFEHKQAKDKLIKAESELKNLEQEETGILRSVSHGEQNAMSYTSQQHNQLKLNEISRSIANKKRIIIQLKQEVLKLDNLISSENRSNMRLRGILRLEKNEVAKVEQFESAIEKRLRSVNLDINLLVKDVRELEVRQKQLKLEVQKLNYGTGN